MTKKSHDEIRNEIEITPDMMRAGIEEFCSIDFNLETAEEIVSAIFRAMAPLANYGIEK